MQAQLAVDQVEAIVPEHPQKRVIRFENPSFQIKNENPNNAGVDKTSNPAFTFREIAI